MMTKLSLHAGGVLLALFSLLFERVELELDRLLSGPALATLADPARDASALPSPPDAPAPARPARGGSRGERLAVPALAAAVIGSLAGLGVS